jgi:hypothetical protein
MRVYSSTFSPNQQEKERFSVGSFLMRVVFALLIICLAFAGVQAQQPLSDRLQISGGAPAGLLSSRTAVFYDLSVTMDDLSELQAGFQQIGIDAIVYFDTDKVTAGFEPARAYAAYLQTRGVKNLVLFTKTLEGYECLFTPFNGTASFVEVQQPAWRVSHNQLHEVIMITYRDSWLTQKKENFLINDRPETEIAVPIINSRRSELYPLDLKTDNLAILKSSDPAIQAEIEALLNTVYPYPNKIKFIDKVPEVEKDLRRQGMQFILYFVHCRGKTARDLLGYDITRGESAYGSLTFPNGAAQVKTIPVERPVYKFYIKHIESGNVFLGNKWDADESLSQAMKNHIMVYKTEQKLN